MLPLETSITEVYNSLPFYIFWKNVDSIYVGANEHFLRSVGLPRDAIIGKKDSELPWKQGAEALVFIDQHVLKGNSILNVTETRWFPHGMHSLIVNKVPLRNVEQEIIGVLGVFQDPHVGHPLIFPAQGSNGTRHIADKQVLVLKIQKALPEALLTFREIECLSLWLSGYSIKTSADYLNLSHKSIEAYRKNVKVKMKVYHKFQLINSMQKIDLFPLLLSLSQIIKENNCLR